MHLQPTPAIQPCVHIAQTQVRHGSLLERSSGWEVRDFLDFMTPAHAASGYGRHLQRRSPATAVVAPGAAPSRPTGMCDERYVDDDAAWQSRYDARIPISTPRHRLVIAVGAEQRGAGRHKRFRACRIKHWRLLPYDRATPLTCGSPYRHRSTTGGTASVWRVRWSLRWRPSSPILASL